MTSRTSRYVLGLMALLATHWAAAVGLGEFKLLSAMNEPLRGEIALLSVGDLNEAQIAVRLASPEDFKRTGVEREFQLTDLRFKVDLSNSAHPVIRVTSRRPIKEPYLNFLVELRWTSGRLLREYTTLLDLPVYAGAQHAGKTSAAAPPAAAASPSPEEAALEPPRRASARGAARASVLPDGSYRVQAGDTLWNIATRHQAPGVTVPQAMQAILAANPGAFIRGNPNLIRRDALLNLPDAAAMAAVDARLAAGQVQAARQPAAEPAIESRTAPAAQSAAGNADGELRLAGAGGGAAGSGTGADGRQSGRATGAGGMDLGAILEEKDRVERENAELKARVANLEEQVKAASRLVEIRDAGLAALQTGAQKAPADAGKPADGAAAPSAPAPESNQPAESVQGSEPGAPVTTQTAPAPGPEVAAQPAPAAPEVPAAAEKPADAVATLRAWLVPVLGVAGALLLVVMGLAAWRGRTQQQGLQLPSEFEGQGARPPAFSAAAAAPAVLDDEDLLPEAQGFAEQPDQILEEVDVCLSFGNEQQARELLTTALARYPAHSGLHLKMLELLVQAGDRPGCDALLPKIRALGDARAMATATALMRELEVFAETPAAAVPAQVAEIIPHPAAAVPTEAAPAAPEPEAADFDLDLDLDLPETPPAAAAATAMQPEAAGDLADFDLELLDNDLPVSPPAAAEAFSAPAARPAAPLDTDLDLFEPGQEMATQIELAEAYVDMGDAEGAREILDYVLEGGDEAQKESARRLLARLG